jgi:predicted DsbA family dithiol-disulfide isomerase
VSETIKVDIWSDVQCPWCYIGKRKFEAGVAAYGADVEVEYHSFELAPDTPVDFAGSPIDYLSDRKGIPDYDSVHQTNTIKAHELLHYAKAHGLQLEMKESLLKAYFVDGGHVGRIEDLADLAAGIGLDRADVVRALTENEYLAAVKADVAQAAEYGIQGVPFFVIDGKYGISGAQDPDTFAQALRQVQSEKAGTAIPEETNV